MKKLQFSAHYPAQVASIKNQFAQKQVTTILAQRLSQYGFQTLSQSGDQIAVSVEDHTLPLSVTCGDSAQGQLVCEITSYPEEGQDWLDRITEQSLLNQLALAVENTLKEQEHFQDFQWKED